MTTQDICVLTIVIAVSGSGLLVNLTRPGNDSVDEGKKDHGTLKVFRLFILGSLIASCCLYFIGIGNLTPSVFLIYTGCALALVGLSLRWAAILNLGAAFTVKVSIIEAHQLKTSGVHKFIRHPSYTGLLLYYMALALVMQNWLSAFILIVLPLLAVLNRIKLEEKVLNEHFGNSYKAYTAKTWKLLPYVF